MKQLLVIAIALVSTNAFASRARVTSLSGSKHVLDTQSIYSNPAKMFLMGDFVNLESGTTAQTTENTNAEGLLVRSMGDAKMGLSLGHRSKNASAFGLRSMLAAVGGSVADDQQNPIELTYGMKAGDITWAGTLVYSNYNDKVAEVKESSAGLRLGALTGAWDMSLGLGLMNTVKDATAVAGQGVDFKGTTGISAYAGYAMENLYAFGEVVLAGAKMENQTSGAELAKVDSTEITLGAVSSNKKDGNEFFYGASLVSTETKNKTNDNKETSLILPVIVGLEVEGTSWLTLRGSLTQNVLISKEKETTGSTTNTNKDPGANSTEAAVGAGLKFNKITVDGSLKGLTGGAATQDVNGTNLLTTVGLTYMF